MLFAKKSPEKRTVYRTNAARTSSMSIWYASHVNAVRRLVGSTYAFGAAGTVLIIVVGAALANQRDVEPLCPGCNVVILSVDSTRADHMSLYGYERETTPEIDAWASDAVIFDRYFASAYLTPMSATGLHTGLETGNHGVINFQAYPRDGVRMVAEHFADAGYQTAAIGNSPEFTIFPALENAFSRGYEHYDIRVARKRMPWDKVREWISDTDEPFFLWIPIGTVHWPYDQSAENRFAHPEYSGPFTDRVLDISTFNYYYDGRLYTPEDTDTTHIYGIEHSAFSGPHPSLAQYADNESASEMPIGYEDIQYVRDLYDNGIAQMDREVGAFLRWLEESGYASSTVVLFESEHGEDLGEHKYIAHYDVHDTTVHVPLVVKIPDRAGHRVSGLASNIDILPTLADIVDIDIGAVDGVSQLPAIVDPTASVRDAVFIARTPLWERIVMVEEDGTSPFDEFRRRDDVEHFRDTAVRTDQWKLIHRSAREVEAQYSLWRFIGAEAPPRGEFELYDLLTDPTEQIDVADEYPAVVEELKGRLLEYERRTWENLPHRATNPDLQEYF